MTFFLATSSGLDFAYPAVLGLLALVALVAVWLLLPRWRIKRAPTFLFSGTHRLGQRHRGLRIYLVPFFDVIFLAALALLVIALARPQIVDYDDAEVEGIDIFVAFDMSGSMRAIDHDESEVRRMERDGERPKNRFEEAKDTLLEFIESRPNDRIGMVLFAQDAFLQFPLTLDHGLIQDQVAQLELGDIEENGTAIGNALGRSLAGLEKSDADSRIVILITDGDRRGGNVSPMQASEMAREMGVTVYPILVGRDGKALVDTGQNPITGRTAYRAVEFPIDPDLLQRMADHTGGDYFRALDARAMSDDLHEILDGYDQTRLDDQGRAQHTERYGAFALLALLLFAVHFLGRHTLCRSFP